MLKASGWEPREMTKRGQARETTMRKFAAFLAVVAGAAAPLAASAAPLPTCAQLGTDPAYGLAGNSQISALTATLVPAAQVCLPSPPFPPGTCTNNAAYCRVDFTFSGQSGSSAGYLPGQSGQIKISVGLPLSAADGGTGGLKGAWNGKNRDLGGWWLRRSCRPCYVLHQLGLHRHVHGHRACGR
jgi:hypothetical protein